MSDYKIPSFEERSKEYKEAMKRRKIENKCVHNNKDYVFTKENTKRGLILTYSSPHHIYFCKVCGYEFWRDKEIK